jgi:hypothetical protein
MTNATWGGRNRKCFGDDDVDEEEEEERNQLMLGRNCTLE